MGGASYDRHNAYVALPQIEKDVAEVKELVKKGGGDSSCPFPPGSVLMFNDSTDPNETWAGTTWESIGSNCYLVGAGDHQVGTSGGSNEIELTEDNLPSHCHTIDHEHDFTQPDVTGGSCDIPSSGSHGHELYYMASARGTGSGNVPTAYTACTNSWPAGGSSNPIRNDGGHTHSVPNHTHTVRNGAVEEFTGESEYAGTEEATITIEPSYYTVAIWARTA